MLMNLESYWDWTELFISFKSLIMLPLRWLQNPYNQLLFCTYACLRVTDFLCVSLFQLTLAKLFKDIQFHSAVATSLTLMYDQQEVDVSSELHIPHMEIKTFKVILSW